KMPSEVERLLPRLEEIQKQSRGNASISLIYADACLRAGRHDKALEAFGEAAERDPAAFDRALEGVETIVKAAPKMGGAYLWRGRLHARRLRVDQAVADLQHAGRLDPRLSAQIIEAAEALRAQTPESHSCALLLADHYLAAGRDTEAARLLTEELERGRGRSEKLSLLVRLWKLSAARGDDESARHHLAEAIRLSPD